jgi:hypothetical protein
VTSELRHPGRIAAYWARFGATGRDAQVIHEVLGTRQINVHICPDANALIRELDKQSAATILTEETLRDSLTDALRTLISRQPPWSDYP